MSDPLLSRFAGPIAVGVGGLLLIQQAVMLLIVDRADLPATMAHPLYPVSAVAYFVAFCGLMLALLAVHGRQSEAAGRFGMGAFLVAVCGTMFLAGDLWFEAFAVPWLGDVAPAALTSASGMLVAGALASYGLFAVGWTMYGLATLRARVVPWPIAAGMVVGGVVGFQAALPPFAMPLAAALLALGVWLVRVPRPSAGVAVVGAALAAPE